MSLKYCVLFVAAVLLGGCSKKAPEIPVPEPTVTQIETPAANA